MITILRRDERGLRELAESDVAEPHDVLVFVAERDADETAVEAMHRRHARLKEAREPFTVGRLLGVQ